MFRYVPNSGNYDNWESIHLHLHSLSCLDNDKEHRAEDAHSCPLCSCFVFFIWTFDFARCSLWRCHFAPVYYLIVYKLNRKKLRESRLLLLSHWRIQFAIDTFLFTKPLSPWSSSLLRLWSNYKEWTQNNFLSKVYLKFFVYYWKQILQSL